MRRRRASYRLTSCSNAAASPSLQAWTRAMSWSRVHTIVDFTFSVVVSSIDTSQRLVEHLPALGDKFVTHPVYRSEVNGMRGFQLKFLPQFKNVIINSAGIRIVVIAPDSIEEFVARDYSPGSRHKELEHLELHRSQAHRAIGSTDFHGQEINPHFAEPDDVLVFEGV